MQFYIASGQSHLNRCSQTGVLRHPSLSPSAYTVLRVWMGRSYQCNPQDHAAASGARAVLYTHNEAAAQTFFFLILQVMGSPIRVSLELSLNPGHICFIE